FGGRALEKDAQAKYLNSPETSLFHKGGTLYNIATARQAAHDGATLIAVEGYVDVIAMVSAGFGATVAPLGTALTEDQLGLLWKMADEPVLCFDGDGAGVRPASRAVGAAMVTGGGGGRPIARSIWRCRGLSRARACASRCCRRVRTLTISYARAGARPCRRSLAGLGHWPTCCGRVRRKGIPSTRQSAGRRSKPASTS